ncbi:MAG: hypothetical protein ACJA0Q_001756 [Saprospiraceae bacterium]|jgi:hypothetical protein
MKKHLPLLSLLLYAFIVPSCNNSKSETNTKPITGEDIVNASIKFHDPEGKWNTLNADFVFESNFSFNDSTPEKLHININVPNNAFRYTNLNRNVDLTYNQDSCEVLKGNATCDGYHWTKNFYTYVWGLPMKLKDPSTVIQQKFNLDTIQQIPLYVVSIPYENENYKFYFDQKNYELKCFSFLKNKGELKGEFIMLSGIHEYDGIKFPKHKRWEHLITKELIGTNEVLSVTKAVK